MLDRNPDELVAHLLRRLHEVQARLGLMPEGDESARFADLIDSMGMVEFIGQLADDCAVEPEDVERAAGRRFGTVTELGKALHAAGLSPRKVDVATSPALVAPAVPGERSVWLAGVAVRLPVLRQPAEQIDALLDRPRGWFASHTGIETRCVWGEEDALDATAQAARECLERAAIPREKVTALLVTSEAPPQAVGLGQALHQRLGLPTTCVALEVGGACTGLIAALWLGRRIITAGGVVLIIAVEAPSRWLRLQPGPAGETAALFGDGAGACLLTDNPTPAGRCVRDIVLTGDGSAAHLFQALPGPEGVLLSMAGPTLASRALRVVAGCVGQLAGQHGLTANDLEAVYVHGGNGRLPGLLARRLGLPVERIRSDTAHTGNLGSVSLPAAWSAQPAETGTVMWAAIGAGLTWGAVLLDPPRLVPAV